MKSSKCDVCKVDITNGVSERDYFLYAHRELCEICHNQLHMLVKPVVRTKQPFNYEWYDRLVRDSIERAISKGKWEAR